MGRAVGPLFFVVEINPGAQYNNFVGGRSVDGV